MNNRLHTSKTYLASFFVILALFLTTISPGTVSAQPGEKADAVSLAAAPVIDVWDGLNQTFGSLGLPQKQINVLGNVSGSEITSLSYTLNGGSPKPLTIGPDTRRLLMPGDFNVELFDVELKHGPNQVVITATNNLAEVSTATVTVNYIRDRVWPLPYTTNWAAAGGIKSQSQVIDGKWAVQGSGLRTMQIGYDRLVGIGDIGWKDYEVTVPITINSFDAGATCPVAPGFCPGIGLIMRWTGNTDSPVAGKQPKEGWWPLGAIGWIRWVNPTTTKLQILGNLDADLATTPWIVPTAGQTYNFKMRVTTSGSTPQYQLKVWQGGVEPASWNLTGTGNAADPASGSLVLLAHHVDATFGNATITRLGSAPVPSSIQSDDFHTGSLNTGLWSFVNPVGDGSYSFTGANTPNAWLTISVPAGSDHDLLVMNNKAPRVMQNANNTDFDVQTKFESGLIPTFQMQGIVIEGENNQYLRLEYNSTGSDTRVFVASYTSSQKDTVIYDWFVRGQTGVVPPPHYMRVQRNGGRWILYTSVNGADWTPYVTFPLNMVVNKIGVYAANATGASSPAFTGQIDYFFNRASPIQPEDVIAALDKKINLPVIIK